METLKIKFENTMLKSQEPLEIEFNVRNAEEKSQVLKSTESWFKKKDNRRQVVDWLLVGEASIKVMDATGYVLVRGKIKGDVFSGRFNYELQ